MLGVVRGGAGATSGMRTFPAFVQRLLRCNTPRCTIERISKDADILADRIQMQEQPSKVGPETALECVRHAIWGMLHADDACIVSRSPHGLGQMIAVFVEVFGTFGLTISESKMETISMPIPRAPATDSTARQLPSPIL